MENATPIAAEPSFYFDNSYARMLEGLYVPGRPAQVVEPVLIKYNRALSDALGLDTQALDSPLGAAIFSGNHVPIGATPIAQAYAGHQFGGFSPQLGDGRALLLGEVIDRAGKRHDLALKGSGRTPFSRGGDGKAALGPVLREYLMGEAMHALGIPTTRALAAVTTGESVHRETGALPGAVLTRAASSHIRVGTFQFFAARGDIDNLRRLADYTIARHDPEIKEAPNPYLSLLRAVAERQAVLIARWMNVGFIHGVMNTDNMTVSGETIDYGPCAFMDQYDPATVFSSIDLQGRYAYANQPLIARWNLARLAEALLPLMTNAPERAVALATEVLDEFPIHYERNWLAGMRRKLGLQAQRTDDLALATDFLKTLASRQVDFTLAFDYLADETQVPHQTASRLQALHPTVNDAPTAPPMDAWLSRWRARSALEGRSPLAQTAAMREANPVYIPRNHLVEEALDAATQQGDMRPFERLLDVVKQPFGKRDGLERYALPGTTEQTAGYKTFCGT